MEAGPCFITFSPRLVLEPEIVLRVEHPGLYRRWFHRIPVNWYACFHDCFFPLLIAFFKPRSETSVLCVITSSAVFVSSNSKAPF